MLHAQKVVDVNELPQPKAKEINKWIKEEQSAQTKNKGFKLVNAYGVNVFAPNLVEAIRFHLRGSGARIEGDRSLEFMDWPLLVHVLMENSTLDWATLDLVKYAA